jgi:small subunit ribosomal protein S6
MAQEKPLYDLVVLLDSEVTESQATSVLGNAEKITNGGGGEIVSDQDWGLRALAYEIRHKPHAQYHLLQFHATREAIQELDRTLHIADGVIRYRVIKLKPGTPPPPSAQPVEGEPEAEAELVEGEPAPTT